jgi:hypothetical protein
MYRKELVAARRNARITRMSQCTPARHARGEPIGRLRSDELDKPVFIRRQITAGTHPSHPAEFTVIVHTGLFEARDGKRRNRGRDAGRRNWNIVLGRHRAETQKSVAVEPTLAFHRFRRVVSVGGATLFVSAVPAPARRNALRLDLSQSGPSARLRIVDN